VAAATTNGLQIAGNFAAKGTSFIVMVSLACSRTIRNHVAAIIASRIDCIVVVNAVRIAIAAISSGFAKISSSEQPEVRIDFSSLRNYFVVSLVADNSRAHLWSTEG
jgi:chorismate synthase